MSSTATVQQSIVQGSKGVRARPTQPARYFFAFAAVAMLMIMIAGFHPYYLRGEGMAGRTISPQLATLVFDSRLTVPSGVRASATAYSRHLVFGARSLVVDLHIDTAPRAGWFLLAGQIADRDQPNKPLENICLSLVDDRQEITTFKTNDLGEFRCTFDLRRALKLMVYAGRDVIAIPMETLFDPSSDSNPTH